MSKPEVIESKPEAIESRPETIEHNEAVERVGRLLFQSEWIGRLNNKEFSRLGTYEGFGRAYLSKPPWPLPPLPSPGTSARKEFDEALDRKETMFWQLEEVERRLEHAAFFEGSYIPRDAFEAWFKQLAAQFGASDEKPTDTTPKIVGTDVETPAENSGGTVSSGKKPGAVPEMKKTLAAAQAFLKAGGYSSLTKDEAEKLLEDLHSGARSIRRKAIEIITSGKRRTRGTLTNRDNELADCRRFLLAAN